MLQSPPFSFVIRSLIAHIAFKCGLECTYFQCFTCSSEMAHGEAENQALELPELYKTCVKLHRDLGGKALIWRCV